MKYIQIHLSLSLSIYIYICIYINVCMYIYMVCPINKYMMTQKKLISFFLKNQFLDSKVDLFYSMISEKEGILQSKICILNFGLVRQQVT